MPPKRNQRAALITSTRELVSEIQRSSSRQAETRVANYYSFPRYCSLYSCQVLLPSACALTDPLQEMRLVIPNSHRINRGNYVVKELAEACRANEVTDLVILHETRGVPGENNSI
jgi:hypothetical protein